VVSLTLAYNGLTGAWWGNAGNGGADGWGRVSNPGDQLLIGQILTEWNARTGRPVHSLNQDYSAPGLLYPGNDAGGGRFREFDVLTNSHAHVELGYLDHRFDWPVIQAENQGQIADAVFTGIAVELQSQGYACDGVVPSGLPTRPDSAALSRYNRLGHHGSNPHVGDPVPMPSGNLVEDFDPFSLSGPGNAGIDLALTSNVSGRSILLTHGHLRLPTDGHLDTQGGRG